MKFFHFAIIIVAFVAIRLGLVLGGMLPVLSSYSMENNLLSLALIAIALCMGWVLSGIGARKAAIKGAIAMLLGVAILWIAAVTGYIFRRPVLGIQVPSIDYFIAALAITSAVNILLVAAVAASGAVIGRKFKGGKS